jgi:hypothetical protein
VGRKESMSISATWGIQGMSLTPVYSYPMAYYLFVYIIGFMLMRLIILIQSGIFLVGNNNNNNNNIYTQDQYCSANGVIEFANQF